VNYIFDNACNTIVGLTVKLLVTTDLVSDNGFSIQLNANSPSGTEVDAFQQYGFTIDGSLIKGFINNWANLTTQIVCDDIGLGSTPLSNGIPAGYSLVLNLLNDSSGNVTGANYQVFDNKGNNVANSNFSVASARCRCGGTCTGFTVGDLSPITAFTVDIVGPGNGQGTAFSSGSGTITYSVANGKIGPLRVQPICVEARFGTAETSNASYGVLNVCPQPSFTQSLSIKPITCTTTTGMCTGARGSESCITVNGVTQCCHSTLFYGFYPWIKACDDGQVEDQGCTGPCY
jgi:hypothetical protein